MITGQQVARSIINNKNEVTVKLIAAMVEESLGFKYQEFFGFDYKSYL